MTEAETQPCERCGEEPIVSCDERANKWDCGHWCYARLSGAVNHPTRDAAVQAWNKLVKGNGDDVFVRFDGICVSQ
ncbi:MAG: hypothetical protein ACK528_08090, partial [Alphaproteobacteria bacterium]